MMKIKTEFGYIEYARFCGPYCEAWDYGDATIWNDGCIRRICKALKQNKIKYCLIPVSKELKKN